MAPAQPELKKASLDLFCYLDKRLFVQLNGSRKVIGILRGYDVFLNIVIRGNSVVMLEALERIGGDDRRGDR
ncbi:LSM domain, eukaryotic/archaea-type [Fusarium oxysporum f. sp. vasinfectum]|nr:LSM domain, eukaryotic/archaea-type [Fusarium oxysporum f. sp. vasinfectum]